MLSLETVEEWKVKNYSRNSYSENALRCRQNLNVCGCVTGEKKISTVRVSGQEAWVFRRITLVSCGRYTSSQLENETVASASSVRTGDKSQLAEMYCSNMFSLSAPPPVTQHLLSLASFSACTIPSRPVPDKHTAGLSWTVSCRKCQQKGSDSVEQMTAIIMLQKVPQMCFMTSMLRRFICPYLQITSNKIPEDRMTKIRWLVFFQRWCIGWPTCVYHVLLTPAWWLISVVQARRVNVTLGKGIVLKSHIRPI